jgi:hypothetical protein
MKSNYPAQLRHRWAGYAGTGKNILGMSTCHSCGNPGPILSFVLCGAMEDYCAKASAEAKLQLYRTFAGGDNDAARHATETIETSLAKMDETPQPTANAPTTQTNLAR